MTERLDFATLDSETLNMAADALIESISNVINEANSEADPQIREIKVRDAIRRVHLLSPFVPYMSFNSQSQPPADNN